ncbi:MAG TPA: hypothetical protein P5140_07665 [Methanofastidiosum sp.]|nr:hypothetical protein [Methanofastidiosum sp.]
MEVNTIEKQKAIEDLKVSLGFWFALFYPNTVKKTVKVWFDGADQYEIFPVEEFITLGKGLKIEPILRMACNETSFFLWKVQEDAVVRVSSKFTKESLRQDILQCSTEPSKEMSSIADRYSKTDISTDEKTVSIQIK